MKDGSSSELHARGAATGLHSSLAVVNEHIAEVSRGGSIVIPRVISL